jgi:hypothetical protein
MRSRATVDERVRDEERPRLQEQTEDRLRVLGLEPGAGNQAIGRMLARFSERKIQGGMKVKYADNRAEALEYLKGEAESNSIDWESEISDGAKETMIDIACKWQLDDKTPAGLNAASTMLLTEKREKQRKDDQDARRQAMAQPTSDYSRLRARVNDPIIIAALDWMRDLYIGGERGKVNRTLGDPYPEHEIARAVARWKQQKAWVDANLTIVKNPHGYEVGEKDEHVGDTLDTRGSQGNLIAFWSGVKINIHLNPEEG